MPGIVAIPVCKAAFLTLTHIHRQHPRLSYRYGHRCVDTNLARPRTQWVLLTANHRRALGVVRRRPR